MNSQSCKVVTSYALFMLSSLIFCVIHIAPATNKNYSGCSLPTPLKIGIFIMFSIFNGGNGGGGGEGVGIIGGGGGRGGDR